MPSRSDPEKAFELLNKYVTCSKSKGTGLGAYSAKRMAGAQGWGISLRTWEKEGTTLMQNMILN
jgi:hypothetical protein